jgi:SAM-dependent methyltransferase
MFLERRACPACGFMGARTLYRRPYDDPALFSHLKRYYDLDAAMAGWLKGGIYQIDTCSRCRTAFQRFVGNEHLLTEVYERWVHSTYDPEHDLDFVDNRARPAQSRDGHELLAASYVCGRPPTRMRVLDYGMGWGLWSQIATRMGAEAFGLDFSPTRRAYAAAHGVSVVSDLEVPRLGVDFINAEQVFEHLSDPAEVTAQLASALRPGGILKISVPQAADIARRLRIGDWGAPKYSRNSLHPVGPLEHVNCFRREGLRRLAERAGLKAISIPTRAYFAFLQTPGSVPWHSRRKLAKAVARPLYHRFSRSNLYMWFRKPS